MVTDVQRIDLHVHTKYAGQFKPFALKFLAVDESHTEPQHAYERLLERGMTMVTITDHDNIRGCLEIAHHGPHVFISEEVSARFPENGAIVHVLSYGITEAQHEELHCGPCTTTSPPPASTMRPTSTLHCLPAPSCRRRPPPRRSRAWSTPRSFASTPST